ncbi:hypothetical protein DER46DRAFT_689463 [Fusarium sp. MPI-SDFR-AT-0072]|nr:hypothetical protein DER46DRAFT_689463 [Fusarium sp. MPI-SDFR-AT-0072]
MPITKLRGDLIVFLLRMMTDRDNQIQLLVTGRPEIEFKIEIPRLLDERNCIPLDKQAVNADIRSYVEATLKQKHDFVDRKLSQEILNEIHNKIGDGADGIPRHIKSALGSLPRDLNETYYHMLQNIPAEYKSSAIRLLQFLVHTKRLLKLVEAIEVIATEIDQEPWGFDIDGRLSLEADVLRYCPSLIMIAEATSDAGTAEELHLAHFSVKESDFPMARYAAEYWTDYAVLAETSEEIWCQLYQADIPWDFDLGPPRAPRLYYACLAGLAGAARDLIMEGAAVNAQGGEYGNALQAASARGSLEVVQLLLNRGADINAQGGYCGNALYAASSRGSLEVVQLLTLNGAKMISRE